MNLVHLSAQYLMRRSTSQPLNRWQKWFLRRHLASCGQCLHYGLALAEFIHEDKAGSLAPEEAFGLHLRIMDAVRRASQDQPSSGPLALPARRPAFSSSFLPVLGAAAIALVALVLLTNRLFFRSGSGDNSVSDTRAGIPTVVPFNPAVPGPAHAPSAFVPPAPAQSAPPQPAVQPQSQRNLPLPAPVQMNSKPLEIAVPPAAYRPTASNQLEALEPQAVQPVLKPFSFTAQTSPLPVPTPTLQPTPKSQPTPLTSTAAPKPLSSTAAPVPTVRISGPKR